MTNAQYRRGNKMHDDMVFVDVPGQQADENSSMKNNEADSDSDAAEELHGPRREGSRQNFKNSRRHKEAKVLYTVMT